MKSPFIAVNAREVLRRHGLDSFEALWALRLGETPSTPRGAGWSSVHRLELDDINGRTQAFYLKRQENHLHRSLVHPQGELTFAREFRSIQTYAHAGIPALEVAFFYETSRPGEQRAILMTRALDAYEPLTVWLDRWGSLSPSQREDLIRATAALIRSLHSAGKVHNNLYPRHIFLKLDGDGAGARLIDLERTRSAWWGERDRVRELTTLLLRCEPASRTQRLRFLLAYLGLVRLDGEGRALARRIDARYRMRTGR
ncbi:Lipopolysaccharide kinase (Kdo/WaaP) family protein [Halopseudomonas xinjiangensis]|uniref:Lipopolysaccharide kinase (Kdo/WaaP) family protein n=1 Tax=Halopseudomonas xinjiangensis TaxID=487184 RepID=A0A1H1LZR5_9GAMM|nr:lipopolysaccharide kinase InaA family protein [Halopseudomonas xinjiangensis]SDR80046.1 Lipopolysaccharide kinase (Kdo/WaaP) family protein [Halopseudomonas xinjiangensis]